MNEQTTTKPRPQVATWAPSQTGPYARPCVDCTFWGSSDRCGV